MPRSSDRRKLASRTRGMEASTAQQIRIDGFTGLGRLETGEVYCPVCRCPAIRYDDWRGHGEESSLYIHSGRAFPCRSVEKALTVAELLDAIPPVRLGL